MAILSNFVNLSKSSLFQLHNLKSVGMRLNRSGISGLGPLYGVRYLHEQDDPSKKSLFRVEENKFEVKGFKFKP